MIKLQFETPQIKHDAFLKEEEQDEKKSPLRNKLPVTIYDKHDLNAEDYNRIIEMAWQDRTHFDVIYAQYGLRENEIKKLMRKHLKSNSFKRWRKRVQGRKTKHKKYCEHKPTRFQGPW